MHKVFLTMAFLTLFAPVSPQALANDFGLVGGNTAFSLSVRSFRDQKFESVVPQKYDYSCGSAALATLLNYHYDNDLTEQQVLDAMYSVGDKQKIKKKGFSLLDMKRYLADLGYRADGFKLDLERIQKTGVPGIVLLNTKGYLHFVVLKGVNNKHVLLGDPALGVRKVSHDEFNKMWNDVFFVIRNDTHIARNSFTRDNEWSSNRNALFKTALSDQTLSTFTINTAVTPYIYN